MRYYVYVSESKLAMLYAQIQVASESSREASLGFDIKLLKGHIKDSRGLPENNHTRLVEVTKALRASKLVGTLEQPKEFIAGTLKMKWTAYGRRLSADSPAGITFWSYCEENEYPHAGAVLALAGSSYHLLGEQREGSSHSHSGTHVMTQFFLKNINDPFRDEDSLLRDVCREELTLTDHDIANGTWLAATQAKGHTATFEFVAKVLHQSAWQDGFGMSKTNRVILGSPLYVAYA